MKESENTISAVISGIGASLPKNGLSNTNIQDIFGITPEWITQRTGIEFRYRAHSSYGVIHLATLAAKQALSSSSNSTVDVVILATSTSESAVPASAPIVASRLGLGSIPAFDVNAVCSGFLFGLNLAMALIKAEQADTVLLIGADVFSRLIAPDDGINQAIFGDGAGAMVVRKGKPGEQGQIEHTHLGSDGTQSDLIAVPKTVLPFEKEFFRMDGKSVFSQAISKMTLSSNIVLGKSGWESTDVNWLVAHQANRRILTQVAHALDLPISAATIHLNEVGNTSAASIPLALTRYSGSYNPGDKILLASFGGGTTWAAITLTWPSFISPPSIETSSL